MNSSGRIENYDYEPNGCWPTTFCYFVICVVLVLLCSCKSIQYVPIVEHKTDTVEITRVQFDSIYAHDSIYIHEYTKGDTVYLELKKWQTKYVEKQVHDTTYVASHDTIPQPYEVPAQLTKWQQTKQNYGGWAMLIAFLLIIILIYRLIRKFLPRW